MVLTKHQKLARKMNQLDQELEVFYHKCSKMLNVLQLNFFESYLIIGRPLMSEKTLRVMIYTHRCAMMLLSPSEELRLAAKESPLIVCIITPTFYPQSRVLILPSNGDKHEKNIIPWGIKTILPKENLQKLEEAKEEAFLYCADTAEMPDWVYWFDQENRSSSLSNQMLLMEKKSKEITLFHRNMQRPAMQFYIKSIQEDFKLKKGEKISKALLSGEFAPQESTNIGMAYKLVVKSLKERKKRHFEDFQKVWRDKLRTLIFAELSWDKELQDTYLNEYFFPEEIKVNYVPTRWDTSAALDRQTYSKFIRYFTNNFVQNPLQRQVDGEIALLIRIMIYASSELKKPSIEKLLELTTGDFSDKCIKIDGEEIELSCGLSDLIKASIGEVSLVRKQKLFPTLSHRKFTYRLKKASKDILPSHCLQALPETFLSFPHPMEHLRMNSKMRRHQMENPSEVLQNSISFQKIKEQLIKKSNSILA